MRQQKKAGSGMPTRSRELMMEGGRLAAPAARARQKGQDPFPAQLRDHPLRHVPRSAKASVALLAVG